GDTNNDGKLSVGETWQYTARDRKREGEGESGGVGNRNLSYNNTAKVTDGLNSTASARTSVPIGQNTDVTLVKTASVPGGAADLGETISYTIAVHNDGNMTLTNPVVTDSLEANVNGLDANSDGFNDGDTNLDGKLSVGETWQYTA